jgi:hypothetical protein
LNNYLEKFLYQLKSLLDQFLKNYLKNYLKIRKNRNLKRNQIKKKNLWLKKSRKEWKKIKIKIKWILSSNKAKNKKIKICSIKINWNNLRLIIIIIFKDIIIIYQILIFFEIIYPMFKTKIKFISNYIIIISKISKMKVIKNIINN